LTNKKTKYNAVHQRYKGYSQQPQRLVMLLWYWPVAWKIMLHCFSLYRFRRKRRSIQGIILVT